MTFVLTITLDNDAFGVSSRARGRELARVLKELALSVETGGVYCPDDGRCRDSNGNTVGEWTVKR